MDQTAERESKTALSDKASKFLAKTVVGAYSAAETETVENWISHKHRHTLWVLHAYRRIVEHASPEISEATYDRGEAACILHDIGRFMEHDGKAVFAQGGFHHGKYGSAMVAQSGLGFPKSVLIAIRYHEDKTITGVYGDAEFLALGESEKEEALVLLKLVRDADKVENMEYKFSKFWMAAFSEFVVKETGVSGFSPEALREFASEECKGTLSRPLLKTAADRKLNMVSWLPDFHFRGTPEVFNPDFFPKAFAMLAGAAGSDDERRQVVDGFGKYCGSLVPFGEKPIQ